MGTVDRKTAEQEFDRFIESNEILIDDGMGKEDRDSFLLAKNRILTAIQKGHLIVNEDGEPVYTPHRTKDATPITFSEPSGSALMAMDRKKKDHDVGKMYSSMADMCGIDASNFSKMKMADLHVCMAVAGLFLG